MKTFAIRDGNDPSEKDLAYLMYYEKEKVFYIELPDHADPWETPLILSSFAKRNESSINAYWSRLWVQQRIVPSDRQNIGQILKENGLTEYDEFQLLMLAEGRCEQDNYYLAPLSEDVLKEKYEERYAYKVEDVVPLEDAKLLVFFRNGNVKKCDVKKILKEEKRYFAIWNNHDLFCKVTVSTGGYGIEWGNSCRIADKKLYQAGVEIPLSLNDFRSFVQNRVVSTKEATEILDCSRQNIDDLVRRDKLHPVKVDAKNKLFLKTEVMMRNWQ